MAEKERNEEMGRLSGLGAGVLAGAALGSAILPVVGTFAGALLGGILGSQVGRTVGGSVGTVIDAMEATPVEPTAAAAPSVSVIDQLERLGKLREQNLITEDEFSAAKAKILG
ncbi:MAG: SHOCT domain-containing protein [Chloroflexota bacterium]